MRSRSLREGGGAGGVRGGAAASFPSQKRYLLPNQDYGAFKSIALVDPKIEVTAVEPVSDSGRRRKEG